MQVSRRLVTTKEIPIDTKKETDLINSMDIAMSEQYCKSGNLELGLKKYREVIPKIINENEKRNVINKYLNFSLGYGQN